MDKRIKLCEEKITQYTDTIEACRQQEEENNVDLSKDINKAEKMLKSWQEKLEKAQLAKQAKDAVSQSIREKRAQRSEEKEERESIIGFDGIFEPQVESQPTYEDIITQNIPTINDDEEERREVLKKIHMLEIACGYVHDDQTANMTLSELKDVHKNLAFAAKKSLSSASILAANVYTGLIVNSPAFINLILPDYGITIDKDALRTNINNPETRQQICDAFSEIFEDDPYLREVALKVSRGFPKLGFITMMLYASSVTSKD